MNLTNQKRRRHSRWKHLYETIEEMGIDTWKTISNPSVTETYFRIVVCRAGKELGCKLSVHKVANEVYEVRKGERNDTI